MKAVSVEISFEWSEELERSATGGMKTEEAGERWKTEADGLEFTFSIRRLGKFKLCRLSANAPVDETGGAVRYDEMPEFSFAEAWKGMISRFPWLADFPTDGLEIKMKENHEATLRASGWRQPVKSDGVCLASESGFVYTQQAKTLFTFSDDKPVMREDYAKKLAEAGFPPAAGE